MAIDDAGAAAPLLIEAERLAGDAFTPDTASAEARGWRPVDLPDAPGGVQDATVAQLPDGTLIHSTLHVVEGERDGGHALALTFRGVDEGNPEFLFLAAPVAPGVFASDLYVQAHAPAIQEALTYAVVSGVDEVLVNGHSLGGILAEETAAAFLPGSGLADRAVVVTSGSPGSHADASDLNVINLVHTQDVVANLPDLTPFIPESSREGADLVVDLPGVAVPPLPPLDAPDAIAAALDVRGRYFVEHDLGLYLESATALETYGFKVPDVREETGDLRFLFSRADLFVLGTEGADTLRGGDGLDILIGRSGDDLMEGMAGDDRLIGGAGDDRLFAGDGADNLSGGSGADALDGGAGADRLYGNAGADGLSGGGGNDYLDGGLGDDGLFGGAGDDVIVAGKGYDRIDGGDGFDEVRVTQPFDAYDAFGYGDDGEGHVTITVEGPSGGVAFTHVERAVFADGTVLDLAGPAPPPLVPDDAPLG
ncbi:MAG: hypothetical protein KDG89_15920 [Geminicoccaceae bacterium]|nr:hypothetical protein [Geminicoccaceae bacterium]